MLANNHALGTRARTRRDDDPVAHARQVLQGKVGGSISVAHRQPGLDVIPGPSGCRIAAMDPEGHASHAGEQKWPAIGIDSEPVPVAQRRPHFSGQYLGQQLMGIALQIHVIPPSRRGRKR